MFVVCYKHSNSFKCCGLERDCCRPDFHFQLWLFLVGTRKRRRRSRLRRCSSVNSYQKQKQKQKKTNLVASPSPSLCCKRVLQQDQQMCDNLSRVTCNCFCTWSGYLFRTVSLSSLSVSLPILLTCSLGHFECLSAARQI